MRALLEEEREKEEALTPSRESIALYAAAIAQQNASGGSGNDQGGGGSSDSEGEGEGEGGGEGEEGDEGDEGEKGVQRWGEDEDEDKNDGRITSTATDSSTFYIDGEPSFRRVGGRGGPARGGLGEAGGGGAGNIKEEQEPGWFTKLVKKAEVRSNVYLLPGNPKLSAYT